MKTKYFVKSFDFESISINSNSAKKGGGIYFNASTSNLNDVVVSGNSANEGGGIYSESSKILRAIPFMDKFTAKKTSEFYKFLS